MVIFSYVHFRSTSIGTKLQILLSFVNGLKDETSELI